MTCDRPIRDRNGRDLGYACNMTPSHLGKCAQVWWTMHPLPEPVAVVPSKETEVPHVRTQEP